MTEVLTDPDIVHEEGSFDEFLLSFYWDEGVEGKKKWSPTNEDIFKMLEMWFQSEDEGYESGYGSMWQLFFISLTQLDGREEALNNNQLSGSRAKVHFLRMVDEHGDKVVEEMENLVKNAKREYQS